MSVSDREIADFYRDLADRLDALPSELPRGTQISDKFAAFLANAVREIREDASMVARRMGDFDPKRRWEMLKKKPSRRATSKADTRAIKSNISRKAV